MTLKGKFDDLETKVKIKKYQGIMILKRITSLELIE